MGESSLKLTLVYDDTPPSLNVVGARQGGVAFARQKKRWQDIFEGLLMQTGFPRDWDEIVCSAELTFPDKRTRDEGNFRVMIEKAMGDALVNGGWIEDDDYEHYRFERVKFRQQPGKKQTIILLEAK